MLSVVQVQQAIENINFLITNSDTSASRFTLRNGTLTKNWFFQTREEGIIGLEAYLQSIINEMAQEPNNPLYFNLFISLQYFLHLEPNHTLKNMHLDLTKTPYLKRKQLNLTQLNHFNPENSFKRDIEEHLVPEINYDSKTKHYTAPDDDKAHLHGEEALRIFFATQTERFKAFCHGLFAKIGIHIFETSTYKEHDYLNSDIYTHDKAIDLEITGMKTANHYWVGHASNLLLLPTNDTPLHVLTDPVEGDLAPFIYPRMTDEAGLIDGIGSKRLPKIDVVLISHNHRDHVSEATLKRLLKQQPKIIVPEGDEALFFNLGFRDVVGVKWWEQATINDNEGKQLLKVTAVPARHWSGRSLNDAHRSAFNGYVLQSEYMEGDIYFAGDTALMTDEVSKPIFERFNIVSSLQPGGPDERREDMESTHQSSADGILMHFKILAAEYKKMKAGGEVSLDAYIEKTAKLKTIYNHTATFKLGNLRLRDTFYSYQRMLAAFQNTEQWRAEHLPLHELNVYKAIQELAQGLVFTGEKQFDDELIVEQIQRAVVIPKIGQNQTLYFSEPSKSSTSFFQHRNLITNRRALLESDALLQDYLTQGHEFFDLKLVLNTLFDSYQSPWHASLTRDHLDLASCKQAINACQDNAALLKVLESIESRMNNRNQHGHMQSFIYYAKWLVDFTNRHQEDSLNKFKDFFACQKVKKLVDQEIQHTGWGLGSTKRTGKQDAFTSLANRLADLPTEKEGYQLAIKQWLSTRVNEQESVQQMLSENRSCFFTREQTRSEEAVERILSLMH